MTDPGRSEAGPRPVADRSATSSRSNPVRADPFTTRPVVGGRLIERTSALLYRGGSWILGRLPARPAWTVIGWFTRASYLLWPAKRRYSNLNFGHVLGKSPDSPAVRRLALQAYGTYARYLVELMRLPRLSKAQAAALVDAVGLDELEGVWRAANGMILVACHVGNNEVVAAGVAERGWPIAVVADDSTFPELFEILRRQRESWGVRVIPWRNLREVYGVLRRHELLALLVDWGYREDGIPVRLFGAWTNLPAGPAALAAKTGASILPITIRRQANDHFLVVLDEPFTVPSSSPADIQQASQRIALALERTIGAAPEQWYSFKPMWPATEAEAEILAARAERMAANLR
ncbi:MAG: lysophospholipid acyltransferase family protein [Candidatus Limnocylindrales bacterium]